MDGRSSVGHRTVSGSPVVYHLRVGKRAKRGALMKSVATKRSIQLDGRRTSVSLEDAFWTALKEIAHFQGVTVPSLVAAIEATRKQSSLSSAIRVFVLDHLQSKDKSVGPRHSTRAIVSSDESRSTRAWSGFAKRG